MKITILQIIILLFAFSGICLSQTSEGTDFWVMYSPNSGTSDTIVKLIISSKTNNDITIKTEDNSVIQTVSLSANTSKIIVLPNTLITTSSEVIVDIPIHVTSTNPIALYALNNLFQSSDATLVLPTKTLGTNYIVITHEHSLLPPYFSIVATENNTQIGINVKGTTFNGVNNQLISITLNKGQGYQVMGAKVSGNDLTGTEISSSKPIAVFAGVQRTLLPKTSASSDHLFEQMFPTNTWGSEYVAIPSNKNLHDIFRIVSASNNNIILVNNDYAATLNKGQFYDFETKLISFIQANSPVGVTQFAKSSSGGFEGDPFSINLSALEQRIDTILFNAFPAVNVVDNFNLGIVSPVSGINNVKLDGNSIASEFKVVAEKSDFAWAYIDRTKLKSGHHTITSTLGVNAYIYALGAVESYGYLAGAGVKNLLTTAESNKINNEICLGDSILLDVLQKTGTPPYTYKWNNPQLLNNSTLKAPTAYPKTSTTFTVEVKDANFIRSYASIYVNVNSLSSLKIDPVNSICQNEKILLQANGATNYKWYSDTVNTNNLISSLDNVTVSPTQTKKYIVVGDDGNCPGYDTVTVNVVNLPKIDLSTWKYGVCPNSTNLYRLSDTVNYDYEWSIQGGTVDSTENDAIITNGGKNIINADFAKIKWGLGPFGKITIKVIDKISGCFSTVVADSIAIKGNRKPTIYKNNILLNKSIDACNGETIIIEEKSSNGDFQWSIIENGSLKLLSTSRTFQPISQGTYVCFIKDVNSGCQGIDTFNIKFVPPPIAIAGKYKPICEGESLTLIGSGTGDKYSWFDINMKLLSNNNNYKISQSSGTYKFILQSSTLNGCEAYDTTSIEINTTLDLSKLSNTYSACENETFTIILDNSYQYSWKDANGLEIQNSSTFNLKLNNSQSFLLIATNGTGCTNSKSFTVNISPKPIVDAGQDIILCKNSEVILYYPTNETAVWYDIDNKSYPNDSTAKVKITKSQTMKLVVTNQLGCSAEDTKLITLQSPVLANAGNDTVFVCNGNEIELSGTGIGLFSWYDENNILLTTNDKLKIKPIKSSKYYLKAKDNAGCEDIDSTQIELFPYPLANAGTDTTICNGENFTLKGNSEFKVEWYELGKKVLLDSTSVLVISPISTSSFEYVVTSQYGCISRDTILITVAPKIDINVPKNIIACGGENLKITANGATAYQWFDENNNIISTTNEITVAPVKSTKYYITASIAGTNCLAYDTVSVDISAITSTLEIKDNYFKSTDWNVRIPIYLKQENNLLNCLQDSNKIKIQINSTMFNPIGASINEIPVNISKTYNATNGNVEVIINLPKVNKIGTDNVLVSIIGDVLLGNEDTTNISFADVNWNGISAQNTLLSGRLILTNVCYENGKRLLSYAPKTHFQVSPNPATESIEIEYSNGDEGEAEIIVSNLLGQTILTQKLEKTQTGKTKIDLSQLPTGQYSILFKTETVLENRVLQVIK